VIKSIFIYLILGYCGLNLFLYFFADRMIFIPPRAGYKDSQKILKLKTKDGALISAIYLPNKHAKYTILFSHGNATDIGYMLPFLEAFKTNGFSVFAYDYHGYGTSTGISSEKKAYDDVDTAYNYLTQQAGIAPNHIIAYGQSVGAALAIDIASRKPVAGVIAESPFTTAFRVVTHIPLFPFDKFNNIKKIKNIHQPVLIIHGKSDHIVPFWHGKMLYEKANQPKQYLWMEGIDHNDAPWQTYDNYWQAIHQFTKRLTDEKGTT